MKHAGRDLPCEKGAGRNHDVVAGGAGEQFGFQHLVGVKHVVDDLDAGFGGEISQDRFIDVVGPIVDIDDAFLGRGEHRGCGKHNGR